MCTINWWFGTNRHQMHLHASVIKHYFTSMLYIYGIQACGNCLCYHNPIFRHSYIQYMYIHNNSMIITHTHLSEHYLLARAIYLNVDRYEVLATWTSCDLSPLHIGLIPTIGIMHQIPGNHPMQTYQIHMGQVTKVWLSCYLVLLWNDSKIR